MKKRYAFTLIEMLVVIAIIGIVASMVIGMSRYAKAKQRQIQVEGGKQNLVTMIEHYQSKLNFYPPDNGSLISNTLVTYDAVSAVNPLLYELTGATNMTNGTIQLFDGTNISTGAFYTTYGRSSVNNAYQDGPPQVFFTPQPKEYTNYSGNILKGLLVPVALAYPNNMNANFWHYDASTTNRHNLTSYDLWAEYASPNANSNLIIGNW